MKIIFFGSSDYCIPILEVINNTFHLPAIVTKTGQAVEKFALSHNIKTLNPKDKNELSNIKNELELLSPDLAIVADYGLIIPPEIFSIPRYQTLNIHFSKLPALRGPSPVQYTILRGGKSAWISIIIMDAEMDTGDIIWQKEIALTGNETTESLYQNLFDIVSRDLPDVINKFVKSELNPHKQNHSHATYTKHLTREDGFIPSTVLEMAVKGISPEKNELEHWSLFTIKIPMSDTNTSDRLDMYQLPSLIERASRALTPWPGLWTNIQITNNKEQRTKRMKILRVHLESLASQGETLQVKRLVIDQVHLEGKKPVSWKQFLAGYPQFSF